MELELNKENRSIFDSDFSIIIENKKNKTKLYDKRDALPFSVTRMPHLDINILLNIYFSSAGSEILRFVRTTSDGNTFIALANQLFQKRRNKAVTIVL